MKLQRYVRIAIITAFAIALCGFVYLSTASHAASDDFKVGDKVDATVSGLTGIESSYEPCIITEILSTGYRLMCGKTEYVVQKAWVRRSKTAAADKPNADDKGAEPPVQLPNPGDDEAGAKNIDDVPCNYDPPGPKLTNNERFSSVVAKREIYDNYLFGWNKNGTTSPLKIGVTFLSLEMGRTHGNVAVDGWRVNDAAPLNATIYHVKSKHIICEEYRDRTLRRQVESGYACFKNRDAEWACGIDGFPKITQLH